MAKSSVLVSALALIFSPFILCPGVEPTTFTIVNKCDYTVWPGILANAGEPALSTTGFQLQKGETRAVSAPSGWGGRFWGRTHCTQDSDSGKFSCLTGDCGSGKLECSGDGATPPATLAEFKVDGSGGLDFYDVSLVDGYNLPMLVVPQGGSGANCSITGCDADLIDKCPTELRVTADGESGGKGVACQSACGAFQQPQYCCSGAYGSPQTCKPSRYSATFKAACPNAYSYAYDDGTSTFTCGGNADYIITFCPAPNKSQKSGSDSAPEGGSSSVSATPSQINSAMVYEGAMEISSALPSTRTRMLPAYAVPVLTGLAMAVRRVV